VCQGTYGRWPAIRTGRRGATPKCAVAMTWRFPAPSPSLRTMCVRTNIIRRCGRTQMEYACRVGNERDLRPAGEAHPEARERTKLATDAWAGLLQVHAALVPKLDRLLTQTTGLPLSWYDVLLELAAAPGGQLLMGELAERVVLSRTRVSRIVDELV